MTNATPFLLSEAKKTTCQLHVQDLVNGEEYVVESNGTMNDLIVRMMWGEHRCGIAKSPDSAEALDQDLGIAFYIYPDRVLLRFYLDFGDPEVARSDIKRIFAGGSVQ